MAEYQVIAGYVGNNDTNTFASIQAAIDAANDDNDGADTISIGAGIYEEQITVSGGNIKLVGEGEGSTIIRAPAELSENIDGHTALVGVNGGTLDISGVTVDFAGAGVAGSVQYHGIAYINSGGIVDEVTVKGVRGEEIAGDQNGRAVYADNGGDPLTLTIQNSTVQEFQKNGIDLRGNLEVAVNNNVVTGAGATAVIAQNGIAFVNSGVTGTASGNTVSGIGYLFSEGQDDTSSSHILGYNSDVDISGNTLTATSPELSDGQTLNSFGVSVLTDEDGAVVNGNTFNGFATNVYATTDIVKLTVDENTSQVATVGIGNSELDTYTLSGADADLFDINQQTGALFFKSAPDFERPVSENDGNTYNVTVVASSDELTVSDEQAFYVTVTDVAEGGGGGGGGGGTPTAPPSGEGTSGNDTIAGGTSTDPIIGGGGSDTITATPATGTSAQVFGGSMFNDPTDGGDNITVTGEGGATVYGNGGDDLIDYTAAGAGLIYGGANDDRVTVTNNANNEIVGGKGSDTIAVTGDGDNIVFGGNYVNDPDDDADAVTIAGNGNNTVYTNGGDDVVQITGSGENIVYTGRGDDTVSGGSGDDTFIGGKGSNVYTGGDGADTFVNTAGASDIITDFHADQGDQLDLQGQEYLLTTASDGSAALLLDGGGVIILQGVTEAEFSGDYLV